MTVAQVIWVEAKPRNPSTGATSFVRLAGGGSDQPYTFNGLTDWQAGVADLPLIQTALQIPDEFDFGGSALPQAFAIVWRPSSKQRLAAAAALYWRDADITVWLGLEGATPAIIAQGKVLDATVDDDALTITLRDPAAAFALPVLTDRFAGTGDSEGPAEWSGRIKRRGWGRIANMEALAIDAANQIYCLTDPTKPIQSIDAIRDGGRAADPGTFVTVGWAGSVAATFDALQAAGAPSGSAAIAPSIACFKWWTDPQSVLTADIHGEVGAGYVETAAAISERIVQARGGPTFASGEVAASAAAKPYACGLLVDEEGYTVGNALAFLLGGTGQLWVVDSNLQVRLRRWTWGASVASFKSQAVSRRRIFQPVKQRKIGYRKNYRPMARGDIVAVVLTDVVDARLSRDNVTVPADSAGNLAAGVLDAAGGTFTLKVGNDDVSAGATFSVQPGTVGGTVTIDAAGIYKPITMTAAALTATFRASYGGVDYDRVYTLTKAPAGAAGAAGSPGASAKLLFIVNDRDQITYDGSGAVSPSVQTTTFTIDKQNLSTATVTVSLTTATGGAVNANTYLTGSGTVTPIGNSFTMTGSTLTLTAANFDTARGSTEGVILTVSHADGVSDKADILRALAGAPGAAGAPGSPGANAKTVYVRSDRQLISYDSSGAISPSSQTTTFSVVKQNTTNPVTWTMQRADGSAISAGSFLSATTGDSVTMTAAAFDSARGSTQGVIVTATIAADGIADIIQVNRAPAGANGAPGSPGATGNTVKRVYKRSASAPSAPTGNYVPSGWSASMPAADGNPGYASDGEIAPDGVTLVGAWTTPVVFEPVVSGGGGAKPTYTVNSTATVYLASGQSIDLAWSYATDWVSGSGPVQGKIVVGGAGSGTVAVGSSLTLNSTEPFESDSASATFTATSSGNHTFQFQVTGTPSRTYRTAETWMTVG